MEQKTEMYLYVEDICKAAKEASRTYGATSTAKKNALNAL